MLAPLEVGIAVRDLTRMRSFYEHTLGFTFISEFTVGPEMARKAAMHASGYKVVRLQTGHGERIKLLAPAEAPGADTRDGLVLDAPNTMYLTFIVDDIQAVVDRLIGQATRFLTGTTRVEVREGTYLAFCRDPEGNVLEIVQYADIDTYRPDLRTPAATARND
ncbi:VOC family protein [Caballeronia insecticola]|uniref:Lactoylglutathione lyase n=1 Tax=Caballeronia insecticola TaxID=758793 RepID=R4X1E5_9BURK|nr:lactoylglutathione lyase [Caballeronia insecticola]